MKKLPILTALSLVLKDVGTAIQILRYGIIENGWLRMTNPDRELKVFVGDQRPEPVLVDIGLILKTCDLQASIGAAKNMDPKEYPAQVIAEQPETAISPRVLDGLVDLLPATATDNSRGCLKCVFVNRKKSEAIATDGHLLLSQQLKASTKQSFLIDPVSLKIVACFEGNVTGLTIRHKESKDAAGKSTIDCSYLWLSGNGWQLTSKVSVASEYPRYERILPDRSKSVSVIWDNALKTEVGAFIERALPFTNAKSHLVYFTAREGIVRNTDLSYFRKTDFSKQIFALQGEQVLGLNAEILRKLLRFIGDRPAAVTIGDTLIQGVVWQGDGVLALQMPLRTAEAGTACITRKELLKEESSGKTVPMPVPGTAEMKRAA